ncbi:MAG: hypothetical protein CVU59_05040 [Deltaproteobacteria bacterium HGW-Deltaproteobacteria-17]|nr:MAG: hypothetical protein CVU59_05040 [Deltaproteobacteria bacterium HGW-Deltaproteobacteria-17]
MALYDLTKTRVKDDSDRLSDPTDYDDAIAQALKRYSKFRPRLNCADIPGAGTHDIAIPADWEDGLSSIVSAEYPVGDVPETLLETYQWRLYRTPSGLVIRLPEHTPDADETVRVLYSVMHDEDSIPPVDLESVADLAASICLRMLAAKYVDTGDPLIAADVVNYRSKSDEARRAADGLEKRCKEHLGIKDGDTVPAAMAVARPPDDGRVRLTHGRGL